ncbi:MAG: caspase family protein [Spirirestis rafaelensis WJT71-NPBG6]|jgi:WD40 repeat protein|nr:caspase family protein [Spirirestis rafaelensis WJT71-NPBG6]
MIQTNTPVKAQKITSFKRSLAVVIGINEYHNKIPKLQTARRDAEVLAQILSEEHQYDEVILITDNTECKPTLKNLLTLLEERLPKEIQLTKDDRLLFYFAGHGIARDSDKGPAGSLVPQDADLEKNENLLPMQKLHDCLSALECRHLLVILDCCFAGTFRWSSARLATVIPTVIRKEHYDRFIKAPAWQAITSAAHNQEALDTIRLRDNRGGINHSPFALALFKALRGEGDVIPAAKNGKSAGDGVISATELYLYLRDHVETASNESQTPGIWTLSKHDRGEYIFLVPGAKPKLKPAPKLTEKNNPYRGLQSFEEEHSQLFFGRKELVEELYKKVSHASTLTVVLGVSGSGKSSLVKAGLIPYLRQHNFREWYILKPMRPSESPFTALARTLLLITNNNEIVVSKQLDDLHFIDKILQQEITDLNQRIDDGDINSESDEITRLEQKVKNYERIADIWKRGTKEVKQLLIVDNFDELNKICRNEDERTPLKEAVLDCLNPLSQRLQNPNEFIKIVKTWSKQRPGIRLLLVIDQFEELITLSSQGKEEKQNKQPNLTESQQFLKLLEAILAANIPQLSIVVTLRSDFEPRFLNSEALKSYWTQARFPVRAMRSDELRQAIERPAAEMALYFEQLPEQRNPVDKLVDEVGQMPGALPLLSFTLSELYIKLAKKWETGESSDRALTLDAEFDFEGGVAGSLTRRANKEYDELPDDAHRDTMRRVMLRMVTVESGQQARRRVPLSELVYLHKPENLRIKEVIDRLDRARLIVSGQETGEPYVEPAHDFLIKSWDKLQKWQQEEQQNLLLQRRLTPAAEEWKSVTSKLQPSGLQTKAENVIDWLDCRLYVLENLFNKVSTRLTRRWQQRQNQQETFREKPIQFLWNSNPYLEVLNQELQSNNNWFNHLEAEFVQQSVLQKRRNISWQWRITIIVLLGLSGLTIAALISQRNAQIGQTRTSRESAEANFRANQELNALFDSLRAGKNIKQIFLPDNDLHNQVEQTLRNMFYGVKESHRWEGSVWGFFPSDHQLRVVTVENNTVRVWDKYGKPLAELKEQASLYDGGISVSLNGNKIAIATQDGTVRLWDLQGNKLNEFQAHQGAIDHISFSPDGNMIATTDASNEERTVRLWDLQGNKLKGIRIKDFTGMSFNSDGRLLIATLVTGNSGETYDYRVSVMDLSGQHLAVSENIYTTVVSVNFSPDGKQVAIKYGAESENALLLDLESRQSTKITGRVRDVGFGSNNEPIAAGVDGTVGILTHGNDNYDFKQIFKLPNGTVEKFIVSHDGKQLVTLGDDGTISLWDLEKQPLSKSQFAQGRVESISFSSDGRTIATADSEGIVRLVDLQGNQIKEFTGLPKVTSVSFSPNGQTIATTGDSGMVRLLDLQGNQIKEFQAHPSKVTSVSWSQDGQKIGTIGDGGDSYPESPEKTVDDTLVRLWDTKGNQLEERKGEFTLIFQSVGFQPNGKPIVVTKSNYDQSYDNIYLSDFSGRLTNIIPGRQSGNGFDLVKISHDTSLLLTTSGNTVEVWNLRGEKLMKFSSDKGDIKNLSLSPDNSTLAVILENGTTELWRLGKFDELLAKGCDRLRDYLKNNPNVSESDRHLCDGIGNSQR